jgi:hypothetical protein
VLSLPITLQAMDVLMIDKNVLKEAATRARICPDINPNLLLNFLMMFKPDECVCRAACMLFDCICIAMSCALQNILSVYFAPSQ